MDQNRLVLAYWLFLGLLLTGFVLGRGYNHDEEQFLAAAVLAMDQVPYRDFLYLQPPAYPALLSGLFRLLGLTEGFFLVARLANLGFTLAALAALWCFARRQAVAPWPALAVTLLFATCTAIQPAIDSMRNDMAPCALALWAVVLLLWEGQRERPRQAMTVLAGLLLAGAVGMKLSYVFAPCLLILWSLWQRRTLLPGLIAGGSLGGLLLLPWPVAGWDGFLEGVFTYHRVTPALWHAEAGLGSWFEMEYLAEFLNRRVFTDAVLAGLLFLVTAWVLGRRDAAVKAVLRDRQMGLLAALMLGALVFGLLPRPPYIQYFMPFAAFTLLAMAAAWPALESVGRMRAALLTAVVLLGALPGTLVLLANAPRLLQPEKWMVSRITEAGNGIRAAMQAANVTAGPVATLSPIPVLEVGLSIYPELSTGPFFYRTADRLSAESLQALNAVGRRDLPALLAAKPPAAILIGREGLALEQPLLDYAMTHGFVERPVPGLRGMRLFIAAPR
ncbi:hypothetical protein CHU95_20580 [Niveispirillum lacus]|uniref:Glycosyltransferase RgtA/B/C/D-like domain-containing protein n=1 Tax=Niveispirillum lacus TaxID=1981099 RepID=A0A255YQT0_9PROT|nr:hypothetical protein [Niveispirillum lacus]OYQ31541.1 hypothetical protein CHU95_20580 [Niveispirillum lacus]